YDAHWKTTDGAHDERVPFAGSSRESAAESLDVERRRAAIAAHLIDRASPALVVYYTQAVDEVSHFEWPSARDLARSPIAAAYEEVDRSLGVLRDRLQPRAIVLASDHGWEFSPHQHERLPRGVLIVADGSLRGFGGTAPVETVAPTVLSLLG